MHYYQFNIGDYASHTQHLDPLEDIAYRRMIDIYYLNECPLPESPEEIGRLIRMRTHCEVIAIVLREFFALIDGEWRHKRADEEINKYREKSEKAKKSAEARWRNKEKNDHANALQTESESNANHKPITNNHKPVEKKTTKKGSRLSLQSLPDEWETWCRENRPDLNPHAVFDQFRDYWVGVAGAKGVKLDWLATWRNWVRNEKGQSNGAHQQNTRSSAKRVSDELDRIAREDIEKNGFTTSLG